MRRALKFTAWALGGLLGALVLLGAAVMVTGNTSAGRALIERTTARLTQGQVRLSGLGGRFPRDLTLDRLELADERGVWLTADAIAVHWSPLALIDWRLRVASLTAAALSIERAPEYADSGAPSPSIPHIELEQCDIKTVKLGAALAGAPATLEVHGRARLLSLEDASAEVLAHRTDGNGEYSLHLHFDPAELDATLDLHEPASGPLENILQLPGLGALSAHLKVAGPRTAERIELELSAGDLRAHAAGELDLTKRAGDFDFSLMSPPLAPRRGLAWQRLSLAGRWHGDLATPRASARLQIAGAEAAGLKIPELHADLEAEGGNLTLHGEVRGLVIPGSAPQLLAQDPLLLEASMRLKEASRPLSLLATHRLFTLKARALTAGAQSATFDLKLPAIAPVALLLKQDVLGTAALKGELALDGARLRASIDADLAISGGAAPWVALAGPRLALQASGTLSEAVFALDRLQLKSAAGAFEMKGRAQRAHPGKRNSSAPAALGDYIERIEARWSIDLANLSLLAADLDGTLHGSGRIDGAPRALTAAADLRSTLSIRGSPKGTLTAALRVHGLPTAPSASLQAHGLLDGAPLTLDASLERYRQALQVRVREATWKSAHLEGEMAVRTERIEDSRGRLHGQVGDLRDFDRVLGLHLAGSVDGSADFTPQEGRAHAQFELSAHALEFAGYAGDLDLKGQGTPAQAALTLAVALPNLYGAPAQLTSSGVLDLEGEQLRVSAALLRYRGEEIKLLAPATVLFARGLAIDRLKVGARKAVLAVDGELLPDLELRASLRHVEPELVNAFIPDFLSAGTIEGELQLQGRLSAPSGDVTLNASGLRLASSQVAGFPAFDVRASAALSDESAAIDARLSAAGDSLLSVTGRAPLNATGALDLKAQGKLDIGIASAFFEARGMDARGQLAIDATLNGAPSAPQLHGTLALTHGKWRDYVRGLSLSDINAQASGDEAMLKITSFKATAAAGTVNMTGTIGALQPGIPLNLKVTASNAQVIASNLITANSNLDLEITGTARELINVKGKVHVNRATIGIPDVLPPDVAVLDVRRRGRAVSIAQSQRLKFAFDVAIDASQEILVQGRGLDAELAGELRLRGTSDAPRASGGFDLQRGSFSIAGSRLTFTAGRVSFDGMGLKNKIDPTLDFTAESSLSDATARLRITGYADAPKFEFSSTPPLPQDEIMARLLFGETAGQLSALQAAQIGAALATLTGVGGGGGLNPLAKLQKSLGFDRLSVGSATTTSATGTPESTGAAIAAGRYLAKGVYVEVKQTTTGQSQVQVDVELTKRLKLQTRLGNGAAVTQGTTPENDPGSSIGLSYQFEY